MAEYIEREATVKLLRSIGSRDYRREKGTLADAIKMVMHFEYTPSADVAPVKHARWEDKWDGLYSNPHYWCSVCHESAPYRWGQTELASERWEQALTPYCPHCGAKMDKEDKDNDK